MTALAIITGIAAAWAITATTAAVLLGRAITTADREQRAEAARHTTVLRLVS